ncbi:MAG: hypothetical protein DHS20C12_11740 [Pseudohongiella sp.]|nr:MAG: hypothetical protein DHS20C12_11740 [Pseudohongiella sp.]
MSVAVRLAKLITVLAGNEVLGLRNSEIAAAMNESRSKVTRDLQQLIEAGLAEEVPGMSDRWRLGPKIVQIALAHNSGMAALQEQINQVQQRYTRFPT